MDSMICIDASNLHYYLKDKGWKIDWKKFKTYFENKYSTKLFYYYEGIQSKGVYFDNHIGSSLEDFNSAKKSKKQFFSFLKSINYIVRSKPVGRVYDNTEGRYKHKCNFDVELTIDILDNLNNFNTFIFCTGDGDFTKLIKYLKGKWKKTIILAPGDRLAKNLAKSANNIVYIKDLKREIEI